jgi:hypothetical protein
VKEAKRVQIDWMKLSIVAILILLGLIYLRLTDIYQKLTQRERLAEEKRQRSLEAFRRMVHSHKEAWNKLSEADKARFNDFHYEHTIGKISDADYEAMKKELSDKTNGILT